jgi:iron complex outermembrane receptor protein
MKSKLTPIAAAAAVALAGTIAPAFAQTAPAPASAASAPEAKADGEVQRVEVTGIRASLRASLNQKRNADSVVEVITAEDVGKMPDKNVADSLQRLPGVYTATAGGTEGGFGENDRVSLRGAPSALTLTTLNGHTVSSGDWYSQNIQQGGRSVSYSLLPSELIGQVTVHKSSQADLVEGGAAGTVDIQTRHPLDFKKPFTLQASAEGVYSQNAKKTDPQVSALASWHNSADTFGVLVQGFYEERHLRRDGQEFLWWDKIDNLWGHNTDVTTAHPDLSGKYVSGLTGSVLFEQERKRKGGLIDIEAKPMSGLTVDVNGFYSKLDAVNENHNYMLDTFNAFTSAGMSPTDYTITGNTVTSLTLPATCTSVYAGACANTSSAVQDIAVRPNASSNSQYLNLDVNYALSDAWTLDGKAGHTSGYGRTKDIGFEVWSPYSGGSYTTHGLDSTADMSVPGSGTFSIGGVANDANGNPKVGGWASYVDATDKENYAQLDAKFKPQSELFTEFKFGMRYADHKRNLTDVPGTVASAGQDPANAPLDQVTNFPSDFASDLPGSPLKGAWTIPGSAITGWANQYITFSGHTPQSEFSIHEPVYAVYGMGTFDTGNGNRGNFGIRVVNTEEQVTNNALQTDGTYLPVTVTNKYTDVLPSFNLVHDWTHNALTHFSVSRTMSRPDFGQLGGLNLLDIQLTGSGGNPNLKPIRSTNYDLDVEYYFGESKKSLVSAGVYYMDFDSYVTFGSFSQVFYNQSQKAFTTYQMSAPVNTTAALKGLELNYVGDIGYGFGVQANYTLASGHETGNKAANSACATTGDCNMVGTSKHAYNLGTFFENDMFSARLTWNHRSAVLNGLDRHSAIYQDGVGTLSASLGYNITKNISLNFEGKDLNNPLLKSYAATPDQPRAFYKNGAQYYLGIRAEL